MTLDEAKGHHGKIIKYFRKEANRLTQERLAEAMGITARWLQELENTPFISNIDTRESLVLRLGIPRSLLDLEVIDRLSPFGNIPLDTWIVDSWENETDSRWELYYASNNRITERGLFEQMGKLEEHADTNPSDERRVMSILVQNYQLAGSLARDNFRYSNAKKYFREAHRLATQAESIDLAAMSVERLAVVHLRQEHFEEALNTYQEALKVAERSQSYIKAYIWMGLGEAFARNKKADDCYRALDQAQKFLIRRPFNPLEKDIAHIRFSMESIESTRGECSVLLGEPLKGLDYLQAASRKLDPTMSRRRCRLLMQEAEAYLVADLPDNCVDKTLQGLQLAQALISKENVNWACEIYTKFLASRWRDEPMVGQLRKAIVVTLREMQHHDTDRT
ncbi:MAG TPA: tetratricopeptide repeat protein [Ktedonobacteraceae bacterium]|nr:tetratricopeptide repeat protein [Ktedonobacteraceae bacterium]